MENADIWLTPLIVLPGVALLIVSTANRFGELHNQIHRQMEAKASPEMMNQLFERSIRFRNALTGLYLSAGLFTIASLLHGLIKALGGHSLELVVLTTFLGFFSLVFAAFELFRESLLSLNLVQMYRQQFQQEKP